MIDYIKILKIVLKEINNTIKLHTDKFNTDKFEPTKDPKLRKSIVIRNILYNIGLITTVPPLALIIFWSMEAVIFKINTINTKILIIMGCITIVGIILLSITSKISKKLDKTICEMTRQHDIFIFETIKNIEITKTKELLKDFTREEIEDKDVDSLITYNYYGSSTIPVKGNLYEIPIKTMLQKANIKSIQNLYKNIYFLYKYYLNNYAEDDEYTWITKQLNAFYNSDVTENINNIELLKNLKN